MRYQELKLLERSGEITGLKLQPKYPIRIGDKKICTYIADFSYYTGRRRSKASFVVEDVKGFKTPVYRIKKKLVEALYAITITEI